jgi:L-iditol 2-dehydrogenase
MGGWEKMTRKMKVAVMVEAGQIEIQERPMPIPKENEVLIKTKHVGICGSDLHFFKDGRIGSWVIEPPHVLGHEPAGEVFEVGANVKNVKKGDLVSVEPGIPCWECDFCREGNYNICRDVVFMSVPGVDGAFAEYMISPANLVYKLPEGIGTLEGALIEPLAVGFHAVNQSGAVVGQSATIIGAGCIGLMVLLALKARGISEIYVVHRGRKDKIAMELGASGTIDTSQVNAVDKLMELTNGQGTDHVFECAGTKEAVSLCVPMAKSGGTITFIGLSTYPDYPFDINGLIFKELTVKTCFRYRHVYPVAMKAVAAGLVPLSKVVSHKYSFENIQEALNFNIDNKEEVIKTVIEF